MPAGLIDSGCTSVGIPAQNTLYIPDIEGHTDFRFDPKRLLNDQFAFGTPGVMNAYCCGLDSIPIEQMQKIEAIAMMN